MDLGEGVIKYQAPPDWLGAIDFDQLEKLAAIGYSPKNIAVFFKVCAADFLQHFFMPDSKLKYHYDRGILVFEAKDGIEMLKDSLAGNLTQSQRLDKLRRRVGFREAINKHFYGEE